MAQMMMEFGHVRVKLSMKEGEGFVIPLGQVNLVAVKTEHGVVANDFLDVESLENFEYPAAKVGPAEGDVIKTIDELLEGEVKVANLHAIQRRIEVGMSGRDALDRL